jgi:DNA repair protein RecO
VYRKHHTKGIIVGSCIEGDSNRRINIFTEKFGLVSARVQGARNIHSKLRGGCQDFSFGEFSLVHGKAGWKVVSACSHRNFFELLRNSPAKLKIAGNILNLIKKLVSEEEAHTPLFSVVSNFLTFLATAEEKDIALSECLTLLRVLHILGFMGHDPELSIPISSTEITIEALEIIAPRRSKMISLINESLKAA